MEDEHMQWKWDQKQFLDQARAAIQLAHLLPNLAAGFLLGILAVTVSTAFAALIFSGELAAYLPAGIGFMLLGSIVVGGLMALLSSFPGVVACLQDSAIAIFSLSTLSILAAMPATSSAEEKFYTSAAAMILSSLLTGAVMVILSYFQQGELIRYIPYPVVGGFLAGSGLLLTLGALGLLVNQTITVYSLHLLFAPGGIST